MHGSKVVAIFASISLSALAVPINPSLGGLGQRDVLDVVVPRDANLDFTVDGKRDLKRYVVEGEDFEQRDLDLPDDPNTTVGFPDKRDLDLPDDPNTTVGFPDKRDLDLPDDPNTTVGFPDKRDLDLPDDPNTSVGFPDKRDLDLPDDPNTSVGFST